MPSPSTVLVCVYGDVPKKDGSAFTEDDAKDVWRQALEFGGSPMIREDHNDGAV